MHLTNYAINKLNPNFNEGNKQSFDNGHKRSFSSIINYLNKKVFNILLLRDTILNY